MSRANRSIDADGARSAPLAAVVGRGLRRLLEGAGFWSAVVLPFVAVLLLIVQPTGWVPLAGGVFLANVLGILAGHCYGREC
ncbi:hypothetical protein [Natronomonas marina]|jgi:hypothetical protein|uniref:hypothetical protein n=1 Tax=Natronomonas marina TaxID=2961939 RepID=UPI0020C961A9|nr:hypothetical protein [Natronomonas marina]